MFTINQIIDLQAVNPMLVYEQPMEYGNKRAHVWTIEILSGGKPAELDGMQATVTWIRQAGPQEVKENPALLSVCMTMPAEIAGNRVRCVLDGGCYGGIGPAVGKMQLSKGGELTAAALMAARIEKNSADAIIDPAHIVPSIEAFLAMMGAMDEGTKAALEAAKKANTATDEVLASKTAAEEAVIRAQEAVKTAEAWSGAAATAETIPHGQKPTVTVTDGPDGRKLHFKVPEGGPGPKGDTGKGFPEGGTNGQILQKDDSVPGGGRWVDAALMAEGDSAGWHYRKYSSGLVEMTTSSVQLSGGWFERKGLFLPNNNAVFSDYPVPLTKLLTIHCSAYADAATLLSNLYPSYGCLMSRQFSHEGLKRPTLWYPFTQMDMTAYKDDKFVASMYVLGRWK